MPHDLDRAAVEELAARLMQTIRPILATQPYSRDNVFIALNALAFVAGAIIAGTEGKAWSFFREAVKGNIEEAKKLPSKPLGSA